MRTISNVDGYMPRWSHDGSFLYISGGETYRVPVRTAPSFDVIGDAEPLYANSWLPQGFDLSPDGKHIVQISPKILFEGFVSRNAKIVWLQNWSDYLKREFAR